MNVRDSRRPPFCWASNDAITLLVDSLTGRELTASLGVYQGLTYLASIRLDGEHNGFEATRIEVADVCGLSTRRLNEHLERLAALGLLEAEGVGGSRPTTWRLVNPPPTLTQPDATSDRTLRPVATERPVEPDIASGPTKKEGRTEETPPKAPPIELGGKAEFEDWLTHYHATTGRTQATGSSAARRDFAARRREGIPLERLKLATIGCHADKWKRDRGHDVPDTILRSSNWEGYALAAEAAGLRVVKPRQKGRPPTDSERAVLEAALDRVFADFEGPNDRPIMLADAELVSAGECWVVAAMSGPYAERRYHDKVLDALRFELDGSSIVAPDRVEFVDSQGQAA